MDSLDSERYKVRHVKSSGYVTLCLAQKILLLATLLRLFVEETD
jgi:hypothetical protein